MKKFILPIASFAIAASLILVGCKKKDNTPEEETPTTTTTGGTTTGGGNPAPPSINVGSVDGSLIALKFVTSQTVAGFPVTVSLGTAASNFMSSPTSTTLVDGGTVKCKDSVLTKNSNNSYVFTPKSATGISFSSSAAWNVTGNATTGVPAINYTFSPFPSTPGFNAGTVTKSSGYTINLTGTVSNCDSLCYQITSGSASVYKVKAGNTTSHTFTSAELSSLSNSTNAYVTVTAYKFSVQAISTKSYVFINMNSGNQMVTVQ